MVNVVSLLLLRGSWYHHQVCIFMLKHWISFTTYNVFSTWEIRPIKSNPICDTKILIYMIQRNETAVIYNA